MRYRSLAEVNIGVGINDVTYLLKRSKLVWGEAAVEFSEQKSYDPEGEEQSAHAERGVREKKRSELRRSERSFL